MVPLPTPIRLTQFVETIQEWKTISGNTLRRTESLLQIIQMIPLQLCLVIAMALALMLTGQVRVHTMLQETR